MNGEGKKLGAKNGMKLIQKELMRSESRYGRNIGGGMKRKVREEYGRSRSLEE